MQNRVDAGLDQASDGGKQITQIMPHPAAGDADDRDAYAGTLQSMHPHAQNACVCMSAGFDQASDGGKQITEIMPHPAAGDADDRDAYAGTVQSMQPAMAQPSASLIGGPEFDAEPDVTDHGATREIGVQVS